MPGPFSSQAQAPQPPWALQAVPNGAFGPLSSTGQTIVTGGYGLGTYGGGAYGTGDATSSVSGTVTQIVTQWSVFTSR